MLVMLIDNKLIAPGPICQSCPMASQSGKPRWQAGRLRCGHRVDKAPKDAPPQYDCTMGFRVAELED